jgi:hypothetical protein
MHRIDTPNAQKDKFGVGKNGFTNGNPQTGELATELNADYFDSVQEEMCNVIEGAGLTLDKAKTNQLQMALEALNISSLLSAPIVGSVAANGYCIIPTKIPGGPIKNIIVQMGTSIANSTSATINFPIPFPSRCISLVATKYAGGGRYVTVDEPGKSSFLVYGWTNAGTGNADTFGWLAIGE